jgi:putative tryptophan/tyrosine transport system substrate-binding protein
MINYYYLLKKGPRLILLFSLLIGVLILSGCNVQASPKVYRVGIISGVDPFATTADGFKAKMSDLGYIEGKNIIYDFQKVNADEAKLDEVTKKFVADQVDLIFAFPTGPALSAKAATAGTDIPVVFAFATLEGDDLVKSVREPGGNVTGVRFPGPDLTIKRFEILLQIAPQIKHLWVAYDKNYPPAANAIEELRPIASSKGVELIEVTVASPADVATDLKAREESGQVDIDGVLILPDVVTQSPDGWKAISEFAAKHKLPIGGSIAFEAEHGAIFTHIPDNLEVGALAAPLADKIFKGTSAGTIPVLSPESRLTINYKLTQELGLTVPEAILSQAKTIIR